MTVEPIRGGESESDKMARLQQVIAEVNPRTSSAHKLARLQTIMNAALNNNPYERPVMSTPPTVSVSAATDATLGASVAMVAANALTAAATSRVAWYGGIPSAALGYVAMPVSSWAPATNGNINALVGGSSPGLTGDQVAWANACEIMTDADKVEFCVYLSNNRKVMFQVADGNGPMQYVDKVGSTGVGAGNADTFIELTFASRKTRRIRMLLSSTLTSGLAMLKAIRLSSTCNFWKPGQHDVLRAACVGDSYFEGTNGSASIYPIPNAALPAIACELLGIRDCRMFGVGGTGYLADNAGTRSILRNQMSRWAAHAPFDIFIVNHSYNDATATATALTALTAEALYVYRQIRANYPNVPIVVLGTQAGARGPDAATLATEAAISDAVSGFADPFCKFVPISTDPQPWLNGTGYIGTTNGSGNSDVYVDPDHIHPSIAGAEFLGFRIASGVRAAVASMG